MSLASVERMLITLPHEQVALISLYLGWIPSFIGIPYLYLGRLAIQPEVAHQTKLIKK